ncbi:T9SS type A sorting domain-containing protein [Chryseobacterium sp. DT-3]|uniref:T9SS type A sorting domain-containing protein n=1 Tax=Chryseobacterium sp. DT-3 TaxID=3396164 RepID=UPI003F194EDF
MKTTIMTALIAVSYCLQGQEVLWQKEIISSTQDFLSKVTSTIDGQYLITGSCIQSSKPPFTDKKQNNGYDFHLVKLNQQGEVVWEKYFSGEKHDFLTSAVATQEGGFLLAGTSFSGNSLDKKVDSKGGSDLWLIKINEFGEEQWQKSLGAGSDEEARTVIQTTDLGYFVASNIQNSAKGYGSKDAWIIRLDKTGNVISELVLGGKGLDEVEKMIPTKDGGVLVGIYSRSDAGGSKNTHNYGEGDYWIIKLTKDAKVQWEKNFGGKADDHIRTLASTSNGYILGGESRSEQSGNKTSGIEEGTDLWLISINDLGEELWQKSYSFKNRDILKGMSTINHLSSDNSEFLTKGILLGGYTQAEERIESDDETFWMLYLDQEGKEEWRKHVKGASRKKEERLSDINLNRDGSIILAGTSAEELGKENWKIVKLGDIQIDQLIEKKQITVYPNPVSDYTYVEIGHEFKEADIVLYDMSGKLLQQIKTKNKVTKINTQSLIQGAYLITIKTDTHKEASAKIIKK